MEIKNQKVAIIGCGMIGQNWATLFVGAGYHVSMYDISQDKIDSAFNAVSAKIHLLKEEDLLRGNIPLDIQIELISTTTNLEESLNAAVYVQESAVEDLELKRKLFCEMDKFVTDEAILASSTSTFVPSKFTANLKHRENCLVVHPINPPIYCPLTELVPAPWTSDRSMQTAHDIIRAIGQEPIKLSREVSGFAVNRLQYAMLAEAWRMVDSGLLTTDDVNKVVSKGLGLRYAFYGPLEVSHMNANGIQEHNWRYGDGLNRVLNDFGAIPSFQEEDTLHKVATDLNHKLPLAKIQQCREWRDERSAAGCSG